MLSTIQKIFHPILTGLLIMSTLGLSEYHPPVLCLEPNGSAHLEFDSACDPDGDHFIAVSTLSATIDANKSGECIGCVDLILGSYNSDGSRIRKPGEANDGPPAEFQPIVSLKFLTDYAFVNPVVASDPHANCQTCRSLKTTLMLI